MTEAHLRDTCLAILAIEEIAPVRRSPYETWEVKAVARQYVEGALSVAEMCAILRPHRASVAFVATRQAERGSETVARRAERVAEARARRNAKIVEAIIAGDSRDSIARRWGVSDQQIEDAVADYRAARGIRLGAWRKFLRRNLSVKSILA